MIENTQLFLSVLFLTYALYWAIPSKWYPFRKYFLLTISMVFVSAIAPYAALIGLFISMGTAIWIHSPAFAGSRWRLALAVITILIPLVLHRSFELGGKIEIIYSLGLGFLTLKSLGLLLSSYMKPGRYSFVNILLLNFFFPIYSAGPIAKYESFLNEKFKSHLSLEHSIRGFIRVALGIFKVDFVGNSLIQSFLEGNWPAIYSDPGTYTPEGVALYVMLRFFYVYVNFSGYSDIAIGSGRIFSLQIVENFNFPILARNLQDFWRRWHISLGNWIMQFVFFPLFVTMKKSWGMQASLIISFFMIGLWHEFTPNYIAWGALHGMGLALVHTVRQAGKGFAIYQRLSKNPVYIGLSWALTLFYVAWVQTLAQSPGWDAGISMSLRLIGL